MPRRKHSPSAPTLPLSGFPPSGPPEDVLIHTDGACSGNPGPGGWAAIVQRGARWEEIGGREEQTTNNRMEMQAAIEGLRRVTPGERVRVVTDSRYLLDGISRWIHAWKRRGWKKADGDEVLNRDLWEELDRLVTDLGKRAVVWEHVRGHAGHEWNERCDAIATAFARASDPHLGSGAAPPDPAPLPAPSRPAPGGAGPFPVYLSLVDGRLESHATWGECEGRVHGAKGAKHRKVRSPAEYRSALEAWGLADG